jgi:hypothetical protein
MVFGCYFDMSTTNRVKMNAENMKFYMELNNQHACKIVV